MFQGSRKVVYAAVLVALVLAVVAGGCIDPGKPNPTATPSGSGSSAAVEKVHGTLTLGNTVRTGSAAIEPSGGTMTVQAAASPVYGLSILVAPGSFSDTQTFTISSAPVKANTFGHGFTPVSPLVKIDNGGVIADHVMLVSIPITAKPDDFVMGFYYDEGKQTLEGLPTVYRDDKSITVATTHFSNILAAAAYLGAVSDKLVADSGFQPGVDDFPFQNNGTYVSPHGECAGQSLAEMFYFTEEKPYGDLALYTLYDNNGQGSTPGIPEDDTLTKRLCGLVQVIEEADNHQYQQEYHDSLWNWTDQLTFYEIKGSILLTGEPQVLLIYDNRNHTGHAIVCYKVEGNTLYVADPNMPGRERTIELVNGHFQPFISAATSYALENGYAYAFDEIRYGAKTALVPYSKILDLWDQLDMGTVGDGQFPTYTVTLTFKLPEDKTQSMTFSGVGKNAGVIKVGAPSQEFTVSVQSEPAGSIAMDYKLAGDITLNDNGYVEVGKSGGKLGVEGYGQIDGTSAWMGFGWFDIKPGEVSPTPTAAPTKKPSVTPKPTPIRQTIAQDWLNPAYTPVDPIQTVYSYYSNGEPARMMYLRLDSQDNALETYVVKYMDDGSVQAVFHYNANAIMDWYKWYDAYGTVVKHATYDSAGWHYIVGSDNDLFSYDPYAEEPYQTSYWQKWWTDPTPTDTGQHPVLPPTEEPPR